jgi:putative radical SAM enzyme (TIGR03279 family)
VDFRNLATKGTKSPKSAEPHFELFVLLCGVKTFVAQYVPMYEFAVAPAVTSIRRRGVEICDVAPESLGAEMDLESGDRIIKVNGRVVRDYLDFRFQTAGETELVLEVRKKSGEDWEVELERAEGEDFGLSFEQIVPRQCANECIFCFCNGNPADARPSLFIKDEDIRLSFLYGNYTTLTSITEDELRRIVEQRLSPQYVSVHATDLEVRAYMLGVDKQRADISTKLARLLDAEIEVHAQVVLCPGINDRKVLRKTIFDLAAEYPRITSVAIVPLGLTRYNTDPRLTRVTPEFCREVIDQVSEIQKELQAKLGTNFALLGDEIYLRAGRRIPGRSHYGDYPQIEDGVGMVRSFANEFAKLMRRLERDGWTSKSKTAGTIFTGTLFAPVLKKMIDKFNAQFGTRLIVEPLENDYFGGDVSVAGLLTGRDLLRARDRVAGQFVCIPKQMLKSDDAIMLDGMNINEVSRELGQPVHAINLQDLATLLTTQTATAHSAERGSAG